jgi:hypothetical protein
MGERIGVSRDLRVGRPLELDEHGRLIADGPGVVAGCDAVDIAGLYFAFGAVVVADVQAARHAVADMFDLAAVRADDWLDALRPPPGWKV